MWNVVNYQIKICCCCFFKAYVSDTVTPGLPTIRDLGIEPIKFSDAIGNIMASMRKSGRYVENPEDFLIPDPPKPVTQEFELSYNVSYP